MSDTTVTLSFPGLGIGEFTMDTVAFTVIGRNIVWYGIIVTCGIIAGFLYVMYRSKLENVKSDDVLDLAIFTIISAMVGARLYYVLTTLEHYKTFLDVIAIWNGGIAIYGGIIGGGLAAFIVAKIKKLKFTKLFDMLAPGVMLGQIIGRWGNFVNAEAFGTETSLPWRMGLHKIRRYVYDTPVYVHPTFLYESLWNLTGFILINLFYKKKKYDGQIFLLYLTWYGFGRMLIESLRTDSLYIADVIRISQLVGLLSCLFGIIMLIVCGLRVNKPQTSEAESADTGSVENTADTPETAENNTESEDKQDGQNN